MKNGKKLSSGCVNFTDAEMNQGKMIKQQESTQEKINEMVRRIVERFDPEKIILFGSYAKGKGGLDSDVDLLIIMPVSGSKREKQIEIGVALHDIRIPMDIIVATPEERE
jgi:predicted nucleotidyltransferase